MIFIIFYNFFENLDIKNKNNRNILFIIKKINFYFLFYILINFFKKIIEIIKKKKYPKIKNLLKKIP